MARTSLIILASLASYVVAVPTPVSPLSDRAALAEPAEFTGNPTPGGGQGSYKDSPHFRIYNAPSTSVADKGISLLESAYTCFITNLGYRSTGLSYKAANDNGPWYKMNIYSHDSLPGAAGTMGSDYGTGLAFIDVDDNYIGTAAVIVHEWGHALTYVEKNWVDQGNTGAWWETVANFIADTYITSPLCASARSAYSQPEGASTVDLRKVIGDSFQVIVDGSVNTGNYYEAWPLFSYLTYNPDNYSGLGTDTLKNLWRQYSLKSNETPLHTLQRLLGSANTVQKVVARYWARMAYVDIGYAKGQQAFTSIRSSLNYANLDSTGSGNYRVKSARQPKYFGSNIIPLKFSSSSGGTVSVKVAVVSGSASTAYTATLAVRNKSSGAVRYIDVVSGSGSATVSSTEEASLVVVNTPAQLYTYDPFKITGDVAKGLDYTVQITGATA